MKYIYISLNVIIDIVLSALAFYQFSLNGKFMNLLTGIITAVIAVFLIGLILLMMNEEGH